MFIIQKYGMTVLAWAAYEVREQVLDVLLKAGANPDIQDKV
jgi:ankyrin repeat protein